MVSLQALEKQAPTPSSALPEQTPNAIGRRLVQVRGYYTQEEFADRLGVHVNTWARYERGERSPVTSVYLQLVNQGVDVHWLLTGKKRHENKPSTGIEACIAVECATQSLP